MNRRKFILLFGLAASAVAIGATGAIEEQQVVIFTSLYRDEARRADILRAIAVFNNQEFGLEILGGDRGFLISQFVSHLKTLGATSWRDGGQQ